MRSRTRQHSRQYAQFMVFPSKDACQLNRCLSSLAPSEDLCSFQVLTWILPATSVQCILLSRYKLLIEIRSPESSTLHSIWSITVYRSPTWHHGSTSVQPVDVFWSYRVTVSARTAAGRLPSLARRPGTLSGIISGIRTVLQTTSITCWKRFCSQRTSAIRALDVSRRCAL